MADKNMEAQISVEFEEATSRQSLNSGETINTLWGKVKRWLSDLKVVCFSGSYNDLSDTPTTATTDTDGLMSASDKGKLDNADNTYALKSKYGDTTIDVGRKAGTAGGIRSTAEGWNTTASGDYSHAGGLYTKALHKYEVAYGRYNVSTADTVFSVGDGTSDSARHNAFEITTTGGKLHDKDIATTDLIPTSLPANGGNADTVDGYHIRSEDVATPNYNWFVTFDNDGLSGINPERAYVGNAGNAASANCVKTLSVIGTASDCTHNTVLEWVNSVNGFGTACLINAYGYPPDTPIQSEGFLTVETCYQNLRKYVTFKTFDGTKIYERAIWSGAWATEWRDIYTSGNKPYVTGTLSEQASDSPVTMSFTIFDFTPSKVICQFGDGSAFFANVVTNGFSLTIPAGTTTIHYIAFK